MNVLIAEDHPEMLEFYARVVRSDGHDVATCLDGGAALETLARRPFDLIVLDLRMPVVDGFDVCRRLRQSGNRTPILALTGLTSEEAQIEAFEAGADDFVTKPCSYDVLKARVRAMLRRAAINAPIRLGRWQLDRDAHRAFDPDRPGDPVARFSPAEMRVLTVLLDRRGSVISRDDLLALCWKNEKRPLVSDNALSAVSRRLRQKLAGSGVRARTCRGTGLVLEDEDDRRAGPRKTGS